MQKLPDEFDEQIQELVNKAYENEVNIRLSEFSKLIDEWKNGDLSGGELLSLIHEFDCGQSNALIGMYDRLEPSLLVSRALVEGYLGEDEIPAKLISRLKSVIGFYRSKRHIC